MNGVPKRCPCCGSWWKWRQKISFYSTFKPRRLGVQVPTFKIKGLFAGSIKRSLGIRDISYRCKACGFQDTYPQ